MAYYHLLTYLLICKANFAHENSFLKLYGTGRYFPRDALHKPNSELILFLCIHQSRLAGGVMLSTCPLVRTSVHSSVTNL